MKPERRPSNVAVAKVASKRLENWLVDSVSSALHTLRKGVNNEALAEFGAAIDRKLPGDVREWI